jgi:O-antigen ligase
MLCVALLDGRRLARLWAVMALSAALSVPAAYLLPGGGDVRGRFSAGGMDPNDYACLLAIVFIVSFYGLMRRSKIAAYVLAVLILIGILISQSRTGLVALAAAPLFGLFVPRLTARLAGRTLIAYSLAVVAFAGLIFTVPSIGEQVSERYATLSEYEDEETWSGRWSLWQGAAQVIAAQPVLGVGAGNFPYVASAYSARVVQMELDREGSGVAHNMFLSVGSELGLVGLTLFLTILLLTLRRALGFVQHGSALGTGLFLGLVTFMIAGMTLTWEYQKIGYFLYGSVLALQLQRQISQRLSQREPGEAP